MSEEMKTVEWIGTEEDSIEIYAEKILDAIAEGKSINVEYAVIKGDLDISKIELERDEDGKSIIPGNIRIWSSKIEGDASFINATFSKDAYFNATFSKDTYFSDATFSKDAYFSFATFSKDAYFNATFSKDAYFSFATFSYAYFWKATFRGGAYFFNATFRRKVSFSNTKMECPANFARVDYEENTVFAGLWNNILQPLLFPIIWVLTIGKFRLPKKRVTDFSDFNTETIMDGSSNPYLKRYIDDEQWIKSWRRRSWWRKFLFVIWELTSHCGRSIGLWAGWSLFQNVTLD